MGRADRQDVVKGMRGANSGLVRKKPESHALPGSVIDPGNQQVYLVKKAQIDMPDEIALVRLISALQAHFLFDVLSPVHREWPP
jgi:hypothetical protein